MRLIWCLCCITDWLQQSQTLSVSSQSSGSTKCSLCRSQALQHMIKLGVYKPFKAGEIRIRFLGLQLTCSAETMEKSSEGTCSKCGIYRHNGNWPAAAKTNHSWAVKRQYQQWWISPFDTFSIPCQAPCFSFSPPSLVVASQSAGGYDGWLLCWCALVSSLFRAQALCCPNGLLCVCTTGQSHPALALSHCPAQLD